MPTSGVQEVPCCRLAPSVRTEREPRTRPPSHHDLCSASGIPEPVRDDLSSSALSMPANLRASLSPEHVSNLWLQADRGGPSSTTTSSPSVSTVVCPAAPAGHPRSAPYTPRHGTVLFARLLVHHCVYAPPHERPGPDGRCRRPHRGAALVVPRLWAAAKRRHRPPAAARPHAPTCRQCGRAWPGRRQPLVVVLLPGVFCARRRRRGRAGIVPDWRWQRAAVTQPLAGVAAARPRSHRLGCWDSGTQARAVDGGGGHCRRRRRRRCRSGSTGAIAWLALQAAEQSFLRPQRHARDAPGRHEAARPPAQAVGGCRGRRGRRGGCSGGRRR